MDNASPELIAEYRLYVKDLGQEESDKSFRSWRREKTEERHHDKEEEAYERLMSNFGLTDDEGNSKQNATQFLRFIKTRDRRDVGCVKTLRVLEEYLKDTNEYKKVIEQSKPTYSDTETVSFAEMNRRTRVNRSIDEYIVTSHCMVHSLAMMSTNLVDSKKCALVYILEQAYNLFSPDNNPQIETAIADLKGYIETVLNIHLPKTASPKEKQRRSERLGNINRWYLLPLLQLSLPTKKFKLGRRNIDAMSWRRSATWNMLMLLLAVAVAAVVPRSQVRVPVAVYQMKQNMIRNQ